MQATSWIGLTLVLVFIAFWRPSTETTVVAVVALILGPLLVLMAVKQIKKFRHEYRYSEEDLGQDE